ncbi:hypothetical protein AJ80_03295 [Polytolypa hystricis UAMH7299]|uniref:polynucleotide adenylyltransferase n=1 Tax=Polytolypa hystricis (strain UAMH7299) TaxID=1447883 RepID=A0A2B7YKL9_POLH7|nr:hypothetical protein AJ80_03295 [Polytolypa hystricis UAMH7299]
MPPAYEFRGNRDSGRSRRPAHEFTFRSRFPKTSARPLLMGQRDPTPEFLGGSKDEDSKTRKFLSLGDITDSDEAEMDVSADEDEGSQPPRKKQALESPAGPVANAPKWSNPDPYTVLPPTDENPTKRVDVVKLIRKARIQSAKEALEETNAVVANDDFISFDMEDPGQAQLSGDEGDPALGSRKRTHDDEITGPSRRAGKGGKPEARFNSQGSILPQWLPFPSEDQSPWLTPAASTALHPGTMLHNEVLDFYHWVKPQDFEHIIRNDLISRLQSHFEKRHFGAQLQAFGSFAARLYLPIADMDLVLLSRQFIRQGRKTLCQRPREIYSFSAYLRDLDIAIPGSIETIAHARVPIIKFVDKLSGLKVDLSFDNDTGIAANSTFQVWKTEFPAMPIIVSVIKQFLLLRGLNEVPTGGLGGFSIICLVTSLLQHLPNGGTEPNLGGILLDFFDLYGNKFDSGSVGIQFDPAGYFDKRLLGIYQANKEKRLAIMDPNNAQNDISGGTKEIPLIFKSFSDAHRILKENMVTAAFTGSRSCKSLLGPLIGAHYEPYDYQRQHLRNLFETDPRYEQYRPPPPPKSPPPDSPIEPPPPPPEEEAPNPKPENPSVESSDAPKMSKKKQASFDRANRLRSLRLDLKRVPKFLSVEDAIKLGKYACQSEMDRDLYQREKTVNPPAKT